MHHFGAIWESHLLPLLESSESPAPPTQSALTAPGAQNVIEQVDTTEMDMEKKTVKKTRPTRRSSSTLIVIDEDEDFVQDSNEEFKQSSSESEYNHGDESDGDSRKRRQSGRLSQQKKKRRSRVSAIQVSSSIQSNASHPKMGTSLSAEKINDFQPRGSDKVECPLCSRFVQANELNSHIDAGCPDMKPSFDRSKKKNAFSAIMGSSSTTAASPSLANSVPKKVEKKKVEDEPIDFFAPKTDPRRPKASIPYSVYNDTQLRKLLSSEGISSYGDRSTLVRRYKEFVLRYNANLDSLAPKPDSFVKKQLMEWESNLATPSNAKKSKDSMAPDQVSKHAEKYADEFDEMIQRLNEKKKARKAQALEKKQKEDEERKKQMFIDAEARKEREIEMYAESVDLTELWDNEEIVKLL